MIKNIVFDLGGVLVGLNRKACTDAFSNIGFDGFGELLNDYIQGGFFLKYELGEVSTETFREWIRDHIKPELREKINNSDIDKAMGAFLESVPDYKLDLLLELRSNYRVFLLSNTNPIALEVVRPYFNYKNHRFEDFFEHRFLSYEMGLAKPDREIFMTMTKMADIIPSETLFIDDSIININAAETFGINTLLFNDAMNLENEVKKRLSE